MITHSQLSQMDNRNLANAHMQLCIDRMKLDKFFSIFLDDNELPDDDTNTTEWVTYREMMKTYGQIESLIKSAEYYIERQRPSRFQNSQRVLDTH